MNFVSKFRTPLLASMLVLASAASAVQVPGVYNTGLGVGGTELAAGDGQVDANYTIVASNQEGVVLGSNALTYYNAAYLQDGPLSRIVNATGNDFGGTNVSTTFRTTFSLVGYDFANATISGQTLSDNSLSIFLNGNLLSSATGFTSLTPFGTSAQFFNGGLNLLDFVLFNESGPTAFQVSGLTVTAAALDVVPPTGAVPEPATWAMLVIGFGLVGATMRSRKPARTIAA